MTKSFSFHKKYRLRSKTDFQIMRDDGQFNYFKSIYLFTRINNLDNSRIGISVSKKYGNAVKRNRLKRLVRSAFRAHDFKFGKLDINLAINLKEISKYKDCPYPLKEEIIIKDFIKALEKFHS